jgi:exodeoxyribonuclease VII large subunit
MAKPLQTQWEFSKPSAPAGAVERRVFSVAELTAKVRNALEEKVGHAWVTGEITNLRLQTSGHAYFTLKDQYAQLGCVLFKADARSVDRSILKDGQTIVVHGEMTVYEPRGQYQLRVLAIELQGEGKLQAAFERLKQKLNAEGLFAPERKRKIPRYPARIGLITSLDGAALHDVLHVIERRQPALEIFFTPCRVQGPDASREIALNIKLLNDYSEMGRTMGRTGVSPVPAGVSPAPLDLILLTRGGGSLEDLWAFNEELTARAIVKSQLPVISAVGHEIDFTISDFAADLRAATPSAAAELITEGAVNSAQFLAENFNRLRRTYLSELTWRRDELTSLRRALDRREPSRVLRERAQQLDDFSAALKSNITTALRSKTVGLAQSTQIFQRLRLSDRVRREKRALDDIRRRLASAAQLRLKETQQRLTAAESHLRLLGPQQTLNRGYSITTLAATGEIIRDAAAVKPGDRLRTRVAQGEIESTV